MTSSSSRKDVIAGLSAEEKIADLAVFGPLMIETRDIDPIYDLLSYVARYQDIKGERLLWLLYVYLCFYNVASAWLAFQAFPDPAYIVADFATLERWEREYRSILKVNIERRGLRGGLVCKALHGYARLTLDGQGPWLGLDRLGSDRAESYEALWTRVQEVPWVGRWAAFKWLELLKVVAAVPVEAPDMRMEYCSGPRQGLGAVYGVDSITTSTAELDALGLDLRTRLTPAHGRTLSWEELETLLCNWNSMAKGRYYIGHDLDENLHDLSYLPDPEKGLWMRARAACFAPHVLGELAGWTGIRRDRMTKYRDERFIWPRTPV